MLHVDTCLMCGAPMHNGGNVGRLLCRGCWAAFRRQHRGKQVSRLDVLKELFEAHWRTVGLRPGSCAECGRPLRSSPNLWRTGMRCLSCAHRGNAGRVLTTEQGRALQRGRKLGAA